jgi:hypothetical protein
MTPSRKARRMIPPSAAPQESLRSIDNLGGGHVAHGSMSQGMPAAARTSVPFSLSPQRPRVTGILPGSSSSPSLAARRGASRRGALR